jgi:hypothetical protein
MKTTAYPGDEVYLCAPDPDLPSCIDTWNRGEFLSAAGIGPTEISFRNDAPNLSRR